MRQSRSCPPRRIISAGASSTSSPRLHTRSAFRWWPADRHRRSHCQWQERRGDGSRLPAHRKSRSSPSMQCRSIAGWISAPRNRLLPIERPSLTTASTSSNRPVEFTVADFQRAARAAIVDIEQRGQHTAARGRYRLVSHRGDRSLSLPGEWPEIRAELEAEADGREGVATLHRRLSVLDPVGGSKDRAEQRPPGRTRAGSVPR